MPTLTPTPTIAPPSAPVKAQAQSPRPGRTEGADVQGASPFSDALQSASSEADRTESAPIDNEQEADARPDAEAEVIAAEAEQPDTNATEQADPSAADATAPSPEPIADVPLNPDLEAQIVSEIESGTAVIAPIAQEQAPLAPAIPQAKAEAQNPTTTGAPPQAADAGLPVLTAPETTTTTQPATASQPAPVAPEQTAEQAKPEAPPVPIASVATQQPAQPTANTTAQTSAEPLNAQAVAIETPDDAASDDQQQGNQQSSGQRHAAPLTNAAPTETPQPQAPIDAPAAQPLRQPVAEAAPTPDDPALIEAPAPQQSIGSVGAKQGATQSQAAAPSLGQVETEQAFTASVQRGLAAAVRQQGGTLTIKLDPPTLGKLTIKMTIDQGKVNATFDAQTAQARDLLMEHTTTLRAALRDKGLSVERLEILGATTAGAGKAMQSTANTAEQQGAGQEQDDQQHDAAGGQSRGRSETGEDEPSGTDGVQGDTAGTAGEPATSPFEAQLRYSVSAVA